MRFCRARSELLDLREQQEQMWEWEDEQKRLIAKKNFVRCVFLPGLCPVSSHGGKQR